MLIASWDVLGTICVCPQGAGPLLNRPMAMDLDEGHICAEYAMRVACTLADIEAAAVRRQEVSWWEKNWETSRWHAVLTKSESRDLAR